MERNSTAKYPHSELTEQIIAAAMKVHSSLGPGFVEKIYEHALMKELGIRGISARQQVRYRVRYEGYDVGEHILDMVVANKIYIELKAQKLSGIETAQVLSGLKASGLLIGLLINFNELHLRDGIRRIIKTDSVV